MKIVSSPDFINDYVKNVPAMLDDHEFLNMWNAAMNSQTAAEKAIAQRTQAPIQPTVVTPAISFPSQILLIKLT